MFSTKSLIFFTRKFQEFLSIVIVSLLLFFSIQSLHAQVSPQQGQPKIQDIKEINKSSSVSGRILQSDNRIPIPYADISCHDKGSFSKSNQEGQFVVKPLQYPLKLRIRKFGFNDKDFIINGPSDSITITLDPLILHKNSSGLAEPLQYELILKTALEKIKAASNSRNPFHNRKSVYCQTVVKIDTSISSFFESFAQMSVSNYAFQDYNSEISRYAVTKKSVPSLSENYTECDISPFLSLPLFVERYIRRREYFVYNGNLIAILSLDLKTTKSIFYINVADTSIIHIKSTYKPDIKSRVTGAILLDYNSSAEINLVRSNTNQENYIIDYVCRNEKYILNQKNKPDQSISSTRVFSIIPDSSLVKNAVKEVVLNENLEKTVKQINFFPDYSSSEPYLSYDAIPGDLLSKPYEYDFWDQYTYVALDPGEQNQIRIWEKENKFFSESCLPVEIEIASTDSLMNMMNRNRVSIENVYIETDRNYYYAGDTIWFSAFVLDNLTMDSTLLSKILYVDLINADNIIEKHLKLLVRSGRSYGDFTINKNAGNGKYRLRAYTQYMRNFQSEFLFEKEIPVFKTEFNKNIQVDPVINKSPEGDSVNLYIRAIYGDEIENIEKTLDVTVHLNDTLTIRKSFDFRKVLNGFMGFFVPASLHRSSVNLILTQSNKTSNSTQQITLSLDPGVSLQFFPESGKLIDGIETMIAYKALDNSGDPIGFNADILDEQQRHVSHINSEKSGVGKFIFTPELAHSYKAVITSGNSKYSANLPAVEPKGYVMNFNPVSNKLLIRSNQNSGNNAHYLVFSVRGIVYALYKIRLDGGDMELDILPEEYPRGIVQIILFDQFLRPQAERLVFNDYPKKKMFIQVKTDKNEYAKREKVNMTIKCTDINGNPIESSLSLAVLDNSGNDSVFNSPDIESYLYIASEIKGKINYSDLNLADTSSEGVTKRDLVLMTQGWRNFLWNSIRYERSLKISYPIEKGFSVDGSVYGSDATKSYNNYNINYFDFTSGSNGLTKINENHKFEFDIPLFYGSHVFFIQNTNMNNVVKNLGIRLDTMSYPAINYCNTELTSRNFKSGYLDELNSKFSVLDSLNGQENYINLPEVIIKARSKPSNSTPDKIINLEQEDPTGSKYYSLFQMITEEFGEKAFTAKGYDTRGKNYSPILVVNGYPFTADYCPPCHSSDYDVAASISVSQVTDVKFYEAGSRYSKWLTPHPDYRPKWRRMILLPSEPQIYLPVVSIKTYSDSYRGNPKGAIVFPFQGIYEAREFFQPDYKSNSKIPDNRKTIYWNPEVKTNESGVADISFYNSDLTGISFIKVSGVSFKMKEASTTISSYSSK